MLLLLLCTLLENEFNELTDLFWIKSHWIACSQQHTVIQPLISLFRAVTSVTLCTPKCREVILAFSTLSFSKWSSDFVVAGSRRLLVEAAYWPAFMREQAWHHQLALGAGMAFLPGSSAPGAEGGVASRAGHDRGLALGVGLHIAHCLAFKHRAPGFTGVELHSCRKQREQVVTW